MNHYTYEIEFENGMKYLGVRSCKVLPEEDTSYLGSSKVIPPALYVTCVKTILGVFPSRVLALQDEIRRHEELDIALNPEYYNQVKQTAVGFDQSGTTKESHDHIRTMAEKLTGRTKEDYEYLAHKGRKSSAYRGAGRTDAQKAAYARMRGKTDEKNPKKGNSGASHPRCRPWYFIDPTGKYTEVYTSIRSYVAMANELPEGVLYNSVCRGVREIGHTPFLRGPLKGYVFGYLDSKPDYLTQENILIALQVLLHIPLESPNKEGRTWSEGYNPISNITGRK